MRWSAFTRRIHKTADFYKTILKIEPSPNLLLTFSWFISTRTRGWANFISHCKNLVHSIVKEGTTAPITGSILKRRKDLGLRTFRFNKVDVRKLAELTELSRILEGSQ